MPKQFGRGFFLVAFVIFGLSSPLAMAQGGGTSDARARELYKNGERLYEEGLYEEAISAWELAYELSERPLLLYNIANALERIGRYGEALDRLNQYRAFAPLEEWEVLERRMRSLERRIEQKREKEKKEREAREALRSSGAEVRKPTSRGGAASPPHPAGVTLIGLGTAGLTTGVVFGLLAIENRTDILTMCRTSGDLFLCPDAAATALERDNRYSTAADLGIVGGVVSIGAGVVLSILHSTGRLGQSPRSPLIVPAATQGGAQLLVSGSF